MLRWRFVVHDATVFFPLAVVCLSIPCSASTIVEESKHPAHFIFLIDASGSTATSKSRRNSYRALLSGQLPSRIFAGNLSAGLPAFDPERDLVSVFHFGVVEHSVKSRLKGLATVDFANSEVHQIRAAVSRATRNELGKWLVPNTRYQYTFLTLARPLAINTLASYTPITRINRTYLVEVTDGLANDGSPEAEVTMLRRQGNPQSVGHVLNVVADIESTYRFDALGERVQLDALPRLSSFFVSTYEVSPRNWTTYVQDLRTKGIVDRMEVRRAHRWASAGDCLITGRLKIANGFGLRHVLLHAEAGGVVVIPHELSPAGTTRDIQIQFPLNGASICEEQHIAVVLRGIVEGADPRLGLRTAEYEERTEVVGSQIRLVTYRKGVWFCIAAFAGAILLYSYFGIRRNAGLTSKMGPTVDTLSARLAYGTAQREVPGTLNNPAAQKQASSDNQFAPFLSPPSLPPVSENTIIRPEADVVVRALTRSENYISIVGITGVAGTGKSQLARIIVDTLSQNTNLCGTFWYSFSDTIKSTADCFAKLSVHLDARLTGSALTETEREDEIWSALNRGRYLLVFDGLESLQEASGDTVQDGHITDATFLQFLRRFKNETATQVIITSTLPLIDLNILPRYYSITLHPFDTMQGSAYMRSMGVKLESDEAIKDLVKACAGNPRLLATVSRRLAFASEDSLAVQPKVASDNAAASYGEKLANTFEVYLGRAQVEQGTSNQLPESCVTTSAELGTFAFAEPSIPNQQPVSSPPIVDSIDQARLSEAASLVIKYRRSRAKVEKVQEQNVDLTFDKCPEPTIHFKDLCRDVLNGLEISDLSPITVSGVEHSYVTSRMFKSTNGKLIKEEWLCIFTRRTPPLRGPQVEQMIQTVGRRKLLLVCFSSLDIGVERKVRAALGRQNVRIAVLSGSTGRINLATAVESIKECLLDDAGQRTTTEWVVINGGKFWMGAQSSSSSDLNYDSEADPSEGPVHLVFLDRFEIGRHLVTVGEYLQFVNSQAFEKLNIRDDRKGIWEEQRDHPLRPIVRVTWSEAKAFCEWAGGRLPTEAEWEYTARGPEGRKYPWGADLPDVTRANYDATGARCPIAVGSFPLGATRDGVHDLGGNVWEWVHDWFEGGYDGKLIRNPTGPDRGHRRVVRGGAWSYGRRALRASFRTGFSPEARYAYIGFRCVRTPR